MKKELGPIATEWLEIKKMYEAGTNGSIQYGENFEIGGILDKKIEEFIDKLGKLTEHYGFKCIIDGIKMDLWKDRAWNLCENAGLLPPLPKHLQEDPIEDEVEDNWGNSNDEDYFDEEAFEKSIYNG
jgi:hypothetical protein